MNNKRITMVLLSVGAVWSATVCLFFFVVLQWIDHWTAIKPSQVSEMFVSMWFFGGFAVAAAGGAMLMRRRTFVSAHGARWSLLAVTLLGLVTLDRALAVCYPPPSELDSLLEPHPQRGWTLRRDAVGEEAGVIARTNSLGLRGSEVPANKAEDEFRILFVGDSVTFGYGLAEEQTLSVRCCEFLQRRWPATEFCGVNAGVCGYTTWQELHYLEHVGPAVRPDLMVLQFSLNDIGEVLLVDPGRVHGRRIEFEFSNASHWSGMLRAMASIRARRYWEQAKAAIPWTDDHRREWVAEHGNLEAIYADPPSAVVEAGWTRVLDDLARIDALCESRRLPWVLMVVPPIDEFRAPTARRRPAWRLREWAGRHGVPMFDPFESLAKECQRLRRPATAMYLDNQHPTPRAMSLIADSLADFLVTHTLVRRPVSAGQTASP